MLKKTALSVLFQTYRLSSLRPVQFVVILYGCILLMLLYKLLCSVSSSFFWPSFPFAFHGSKQHFGTVKGLPQCICNPCRIDNGKQKPTDFTSNKPVLRKHEKSLNPVLAVKCCRLITNPLQSTTKCCGCPLLIQECVCVGLCSIRMVYYDTFHWLFEDTGISSH